MNRLKEKYLKEIQPKLQEQFGYKNTLSVPRLSKVVLNMGVGIAATEPKELDGAIEDLTLIAGQKPVKTIAKKSISTFKMRKGQAIGCKVTLRGDRMYEFLDKLFNVVFPRVRDFRGVSLKSFDKMGNYSIGFREQSIFPEIDTSKLNKVRSLEVIIATTATKKEPAEALLRLLGMPFERDR